MSLTLNGNKFPDGVYVGDGTSVDSDGNSASYKVKLTVQNGQMKSEYTIPTSGAPYKPTFAFTLGTPNSSGFFDVDVQSPQEGGRTGFGSTYAKGFGIVGSGAGLVNDTLRVREDFQVQGNKIVIDGSKDAYDPASFSTGTPRNIHIRWIEQLARKRG